MDNYGNFTKIDKLSREKQREINENSRIATDEMRKKQMVNAAEHGEAYVSPAKAIESKELTELRKENSEIKSMMLKLMDKFDGETLEVKAVVDTPEAEVATIEEEKVVVEEPKLTPAQKAQITKAKNLMIKKLEALDVTLTGNEDLDELTDLMADADDNQSAADL